MKLDQLFVFAALNNLGRACSKFGFDLVDDWDDEGCKKAEDKNVNLICEFLVKRF